ncbi:MAG TPA: hypothetical protein VLS90_01580, partial [Thermodesulfobacteriota bacterium]|nr:hypothetical protein [Thermodesulfobacteriota bacterium]
MKENVTQHYDRLSAFLRALIFRVRLLFFLESILLFLTALFLILLGSFFPLSLGQVFWYVAFAYSIAALAILVFLLARGVLNAFLRPSPARMAREVEARFPKLLRDDITNSLLLFPQLDKESASGRMSSGLIAAQIGKTAEKVSSLRPGEIVSLGRAGRHLRLLVPASLAFIAAVVLDPSFLNRSLALVTNPLSAIPVRDTRITLDPKGSVILRGTPLRIQATATGTVPDKLSLAIWPEAGQEIRVAMSSRGNGSFFYPVANPQVSFRYQAYNGSSASPVYTVRVVEPPDIKNVRVVLTPPEYSGLPRESREGGHIEALKGTAVSLEGDLTKEVAEGEMLFNEEAKLALEIQRENFRGSWLVLSPGYYSFQIKDEFGFTNPDPVRYDIRVRPDNPPEAEILVPVKDLEITGEEEIPVT